MAESPKVLMVSEEIEGCNLRGGLGRAVCGLAKHLRNSGVDARVCLTFPWSIDTSKGWKMNPGEFFYKKEIEGVPVYADSARDWIFTGERKAPVTYPLGNITTDDLFRWRDYAQNFLSRLEQFEKSENFRPDILHLHDWPMAFIAQLVKEDRNKKPEERAYKDIKTLFVVHNRAYDGRVMLTNENVRKIIEGLHLDNISLQDFLARFSLDGAFSMQKIGVANADLATTVSRDYASYLNNAECMEPLPVKFGISSGLDETVQSVFNEVKFEYSGEVFGNELEKILRVKKSAKASLFAYKDIYSGEGTRMIDVGKPLFAMISRLDTIKGVERVLDILPQFKGEDICVFIGGPVRDESIEAKLLLAQKQYKGTHIIHPEFMEREEVSMVLKAADFFLAPSYTMPEPDGFSVKEAMVHLAVPIIQYSSFQSFGGYDSLIGVSTKIGVKPLPFHLIDLGYYPYNPSVRYFNNRLQEVVQFAISEKPQDLMAKRKAIIDAVRKGIFSWEPAVQMYREAYKGLLTKGQDKK